MIAFPVLSLSVILQSAVITRIPLLSGFADLTLIVLIAWAIQDSVTTAWHWAILAAAITAFVSEVPLIAILVGYLLVVYLTQSLQRRMWQAPMLGMFVLTFLGSIITQMLSYLTLTVLGIPLPFQQTMGLVILPGVLLNLLLVVPVFLILRDLARWANPYREVE